MTPKDIRKQVRNVVVDILQETMTSEQFNELNKRIEAKLKQIEADVKKTMSEMNERHRDVMGYLVRNVTNGPIKSDPK